MVAPQNFILQRGNHEIQTRVRTPGRTRHFREIQSRNRQTPKSESFSGQVVGEKLFYKRPGSHLKNSYRIVG